jgi:homeodomain-containing protein
MSQHIPLYLKPYQRETLESLLRAGQMPVRTQTRARILLLTDRSTGDFRTDAQAAEALFCSSATVANVRKRFLNEGLEAALYEKPRPGRAPKFTGDLEAQMTVLACSDPPEGCTRWTVRLLADQMVELGLVESVSRSTIGERLKKTKSSPGK